MFCPGCGHKLKGGESFCTNCGRSLKKSKPSGVAALKTLIAIGAIQPIERLLGLVKERKK